MTIAAVVEAQYRKGRGRALCAMAILIGATMDIILTGYVTKKNKKKQRRRAMTDFNRMAAEIVFPDSVECGCACGRHEWNLAMNVQMPEHFDPCNCIEHAWILLDWLRAHGYVITIQVHGYDWIVYLTNTKNGATIEGDAGPAPFAITCAFLEAMGETCDLEDPHPKLHSDAGTLEAENKRLREAGDGLLRAAVGMRTGSLRPFDFPDSARTVDNYIRAWREVCDE